MSSAINSWIPRGIGFRSCGSAERSNYYSAAFCRKQLSKLKMCDDLNLHVRALGQRGNLDRGARREIAREILRVNLVHAREVAEVGQEHRAFHDIGEGEFLVVQNGLHVF